MRKRTKRRLRGVLLLAVGIWIGHNLGDISEIMQNPAVLLDAVGEWFEIHNTRAAPVDIQGWTINDRSGIES